MVVNLAGASIAETNRLRSLRPESLGCVRRDRLLHRLKALIEISISPFFSMLFPHVNVALQFLTLSPNVQVASKVLWGVIHSGGLPHSLEGGAHIIQLPGPCCDSTRARLEARNSLQVLSHESPDPLQMKRLHLRPVKFLQPNGIYLRQVFWSRF